MNSPYQNLPVKRADDRPDNRPDNRPEKRPGDMPAVDIPPDDKSRDKPGWQAHLQLYFIQSTAQPQRLPPQNNPSKQKTVLGRCHFYGPLRVQRAFYPEGNLAHVYILHPPGGVVGGDQLSIELNVEKHCQVLCTTPGSGKFYLSAGNWAELKQHFQVANGASLEWLPQENILFSGARLRARTRIDLEEKASFIGWDMSCLGRPSSGESFTQGAFDSRLKLYRNKKLLLIENQRVFNTQQLDALAGLRGQPVQATLLALPCNEQHLEMVQHQLSDNNASGDSSTSKLIAVTLVDGLLIVRAMGDNSEKIKKQLTQIWQVLRPHLLNRFAVHPRIWAT